MNLLEKTTLFRIVEGLLALAYPEQQPTDIYIEEGYGITVTLESGEKFETDFEHLVDELRTIGNRIKKAREEGML